MTPLQRAALDFCREVLGWSDAVFIGQATEVWENRHICSSLNPKNFKHTELNVVMKAVRGWCDEQGLTLVVTSQPPTKMFRWRVQVSSHGYTLDNDLPHALLAACVDAHRKLKGLKHD